MKNKKDWTQHRALRHTKENSTRSVYVVAQKKSKQPILSDLSDTRSHQSWRRGPVCPVSVSSARFSGCVTEHKTIGVQWDAPTAWWREHYWSLTSFPVLFKQKRYFLLWCAHVCSLYVLMHAWIICVFLAGCLHMQHVEVWPGNEALFNWDSSVWSCLNPPILT